MRALATAWIVLPLTLFTGAPGCRGHEDDESMTQAAVSVGTAVASAQAFTNAIGALGTVAPRAGHVASLSAPAPSRVARVLVTTGQHVAHGQILVELEQAPFRANAASAEAALGAAERTYERAERLAREGIAPRKEVEQAAADLARARADAAAAERMAQLSTLRAPLAGVVTRMTASLGASVDANQALVEISDPNALDILLNVTPSDAARIRTGAKVSLSAGQDASGEPLGVGTVTEVAGAVDSASRSVEIRVQAPTTRRPLRIGETVFGSIALGVAPSAIVVPAEALVPEGDGFKVFVVDAAGIAHARPVVVGGRTAQIAEIKSGLTAGERVVTYGAYGVEDSAKVIPIKP